MKAKVTYGLARTQHVFLFADKFAVGASLEISLFWSPLKILSTIKVDVELHPSLFGLSVLPVTPYFTINHDSFVAFFNLFATNHLLNSITLV